MGTFIVSFVGNGFVRQGEQLPQLRSMSPQRRRRLLVFLYYTAIVSLFTLFGVLIIPDVIREGADFVHRLETDNLWVVVVEKMRKGLGEGVMDQLERFILVASTDDVTRTIDFAQMDKVSSLSRGNHVSLLCERKGRRSTLADYSAVEVSFIACEGSRP
jgi:hypothetical protein